MKIVTALAFVFAMATVSMAYANEPTNKADCEKAHMNGTTRTASARRSRLLLRKRAADAQFAAPLYSPPSIAPRPRSAAAAFRPRCRPARQNPALLCV